MLFGNRLAGGLQVRVGLLKPFPQLLLPPAHLLEPTPQDSAMPLAPGLHFLRLLASPLRLPGKIGTLLLEFDLPRPQPLRELRDLLPPGRDFQGLRVQFCCLLPEARADVLEFLRGRGRRGVLQILKLTRDILLAPAQLQFLGRNRGQVLANFPHEIIDVRFPPAIHFGAEGRNSTRQIVRRSTLVFPWRHHTHEIVSARHPAAQRALSVAPSHGCILMPVSAMRATKLDFPDPSAARNRR
ncbi:MAG: hypothetical protein IPM18_10545 [Phycisphaerales bacterium]|nr:hypothetical protein [Phycisphaerales bacterium]